MNTVRFSSPVRFLFPALAILALATISLPVTAQIGSVPVRFNLPSPAAMSVRSEAFVDSSSSSLDSVCPEGSPDSAPRAAKLATGGIQGESVTRPLHRPFRSLSLTAKVGIGGIGFDVATPVAPHLQIRAGAQFFGHTVGFVADGLHSDAAIQLQNVALMVDVFPFHNGFHLSPGVTLNNGNHIAATVNVPGGQQFTLGGTNFTSSMSDPVRGAGAIRFGNRVAPRFTLGWEDALHHRFGHISVPVEFGFQYSAAPVVTLALSGSACVQQGCSSVNSYGVMADTQQEVLKLQNDLHPLRFYPITSTGIRYTFGR